MVFPNNKYTTTREFLSRVSFHLADIFLNRETDARYYDLELKVAFANGSEINGKKGKAGSKLVLL